jgi:hypothetical protein
MPRRHRALTCAAVPLGLLALLLLTDTAQAHRLEADYRVLPDSKVQVEGWFDLGGLPKGARVQVFRPDGSLLSEGKLDGDARYVFPYRDAEALKVVVSSAGHRKEFGIPAAELTAGATIAVPSPGNQEQRAETDLRTEHASRVSVKDVLVGVGFLLAVAAFVLSLRNARQLRELRRARAEAAEQDDAAGVA